MISKLSIIIPAFDEEKTIHLILDKVKDVVLMNNLTKEVIIIDDCSRDQTYKRIQEYQLATPELNIQLFRHEKNKGKGAALHTGIKEATGDIIVIQDAD
ncbi:MAG TPA: glycosyltransferase family 2 protein, partial [Flavobacterium sp.]|nr:glycosyltransferase family 2 protein [Flavobacterium sp.]